MGRKLTVGSKSIDIQLGGADAGKTPPVTVVQARKELNRNASTFNTFQAQSQEFIDNELDDTPYGDALCSNWNLFRRMHKQNSKLASALLVDSLQHLMNGPKILGKQMEAAGIQEYTTKGDFPAEILDTIEVYHTNIRDIDTGWKEIFDVKDFTGSKRGGFKIRDVQSGLTYRRVPTGDKVEVYGMSGDEVEVPFYRYGGALGWDRTWFQDEEYWQVTDTALEFRNKYYNDQARIHYALIEALPAGINRTWVAPSPAALAATDAQYELSRDINTINEACVEIILALEAAGMDVTATSSFVLLAPLNLKARMNRALQATYGQASLRNPTQIDYIVNPVYTTRLTSTTQYYVALPKRKAKSGIRRDLEVFADFDILSYSDVTAAWGRYGAGIAENDQFRRCAIA